MQILHGNDTTFLMAVPPLKTRFFVRDKHAYAYLIAEDGRQFAEYSADIGNVAIDFLYDSVFEQITGFLDVSKELVAQIKCGGEAQWTRFETFARVLFNSGEMHPFYYPLFVHVANAYRLRMHDDQGQPLTDDYFARLGEDLKKLKTDVAALLDAQDAIGDSGDVIDCYHKNAFLEPLPIPNLQAELIGKPDEQPELVMVLSPQNPKEMWNYLLSCYVTAAMRFKRCEHCKRFFATTGRGNPKFCERIIEGKGKSCRQLMPKLNFNSKAEKDPAVWLYNRAYKTMYSRITAGTLQKDMFNQWAKRARVQRDACSRGEITPEIYSAWLCDNGLFIDYLKETN